MADLTIAKASMPIPDVPGSSSSDSDDGNMDSSYEPSVHVEDLSGIDSDPPV